MRTGAGPGSVEQQLESEEHNRKQLGWSMVNKGRAVSNEPGRSRWGQFTRTMQAKQSEGFGLTA